MSITQPDVTLLLDMQGVIQEVALSDSLSEESVTDWIGRSWTDTVADVGGEKVRRMVEDARNARVSVFRQITQKFPSGRELLLEYTTVRLWGKAGLIAVGKNLNAMAELQTRLVSAQQAIERDYWKLREVETRYRMLFTASNEPILVVTTADMRVIEANPAATRALLGDVADGTSANGRLLMNDIQPSDRERLLASLARVKEQGAAPSSIIHLGAARTPWLLRASLMKAREGAAFLLQLAPAGEVEPVAAPQDPISIEDLVETMPDAFVVIDDEGLILRANRAFLELVEAPSVEVVRRERLSRWMGRPGADVAVLLANVRLHGSIRLFNTIAHGLHGSEAEVEISASGNTTGNARWYGVLLRHVGRRLDARPDDGRLSSSLAAITARIGKASLPELVRETVEVVEQHCVEASLELANGNRTAASELLGLSRQSLYAKLNKYGLDGHGRQLAEDSVP